MSNTRLLVLQALSPVHCGTGHAVSGIDLPIAREKPTGLPIVPGSSIKGVLRAAASSPGDDTHLAAFGPDTANASEHAGALQFGDVALAFLPMRSLRGTFAYVTSPYLLRRLARCLAEAGLGNVPALPPAPPASEALVIGTALTGGSQGRVVLEDFDFTTQQPSGPLKAFTSFFAKHLPGGDEAFFAERVCVVHDDVMGVLLQTATEVTQRIRLDPDTKTVAPGALWSEEALPVESILVGLVVATVVRRPKNDALSESALLTHVEKLVEKGVIQVGGNASVGRGLCRIKLGKGA